MKALYVTDDIDTCDCCGRTGLKATVAMQLSDGGILYYGRTCAARNSGKDRRQIKEEIANSLKARIDAAYNEAKETPEKKAWQDKRVYLYEKYKGNLTNNEWVKMIAPEADALCLVKERIAKKYHIPVSYF